MKVQWYPTLRFSKKFKTNQELRPLIIQSILIGQGYLKFVSELRIKINFALIVGIHRWKTCLLQAEFFDTF